MRAALSYISRFSTWNLLTQKSIKTCKYEKPPIFFCIVLRKSRRKINILKLSSVIKKCVRGPIVWGAFIRWCKCGKQFITFKMLTMWNKFKSNVYIKYEFSHTTVQPQREWNFLIWKFKPVVLLSNGFFICQGKN